MVLMILLQVRIVLGRLTVVPWFSPRSFRDLAANEALAAKAMLQLLGVGALLLVPGAQHRPAPRRRCRACVAAEPVPLPTSPKDVATQMSYAVQADAQKRRPTLVGGSYGGLSRSAV